MSGYLDTVLVRAKKGGELTGSNPTDCGKAGTKYHLLVTAGRQLLAVTVNGVNRHDSMMVEPILDGLVSVKGRGRGQPRHWPEKLHADKAYDNKRVRRYLSRCGFTARIRRIGVESSERLGRHRWVAASNITR